MPPDRAHPVLSEDLLVSLNLGLARLDLFDDLLLAALHGLLLDEGLPPDPYDVVDLALLHELFDFRLLFFVLQPLDAILQHTQLRLSLFLLLQRVQHG